MLMYALNKIRGGAFSDLVTGTSEYAVPTGYSAYAFRAGSDGATIDTGTWLIKNVETTISAAYKSKWVDQSVTGGFIRFDHPVMSLTLSAGDGVLFCRKNVREPSLTNSDVITADDTTTTVDSTTWTVDSM